MHSGPYTHQTNLVFAIDGASRRSAFRSKQDSNILPSPHNWATGTGGQTGYGANGSASEQNRVLVTDDPWGRSSITWRTTPDSTSGADGGWNTSYYSIDRTYTYRYSVWVRRYTTGTGGTFYMGMNPNPIRNDNGASQGNPYFTYPAISSLTYNQWYLVVGHVFYTGYSGGERHPDSGWWENGVKISDKSYGNVGSKDVRWASDTTSARHRTYHYYTTNTSSGIEFAYPRVDKLDGTAPTISELLNRGESGWRDIKGKSHLALTNGVGFNSDQKAFTFDGSDDQVSTEKTASELGIYDGAYTMESVFRVHTTSGDNMVFGTTQTNSRQGLHVGVRNGALYQGHYGADRSGGSISANTWYHVVWVYTGTQSIIYVNGSSVNSLANQSSFIGTTDILIGKHWGAFDGDIAVAKIYTKAFSSTEVVQNYKAYKNRFNI